MKGLLFSMTPPPTGFLPCPWFGFADSGQVINGPAGRALTEYTVDVNGNSLHVHI